MLHNLRVRAQSEKGFTLVELLVVMLILGLLAAIAVPAFFNQRDKAADSEAKTTAKTTQTALETYATDQPGGVYTGGVLTALDNIEPTLTGADVVVDPTTPAGGYTITSDSTSGNAFQIIRSGTGTITYPCTTAGEGGCPTGGWGG